MKSLFAFFMLFLVVVIAVVAARFIAANPTDSGFPLSVGAHAADAPLTPFSTEKGQARFLSKTLGGEKQYYSPKGAGWIYQSHGTKRVRFTVPKGALVDTTNGMRWEGQRVDASQFYIWWP
jgi:hypothetical protein